MTEQAHQDNLVEYAKTLVEQLESGDAKEAMRTISSLHNQRDQVLFQEVGKLTRSLHESIKNFAIDTSNSEMREEMSRMQDASDRLSYVIEKTETAANKTMDMVENTMPVSAHLRETASNLKSEWDRLMRREMTADEFRQLTKKIDGFLCTAVDESTRIDSNLSNIMLAQDYQDLTGQVIKRVIQLVKEVEDNLVNLVTMASTIDQITGLKHDISQTQNKSEEDPIGPEGPIINPEAREDVVSNQDDVDALLSSLGF
ncbi:MAG: protein phosphatase [Pseudomonadales bacterium]|jgi:chemotaxis protein CheZ|uniref:protein phosphatase CheZ n=1 Tax=unclassified Ketobacter TaxID=2639109 RepID=UPI000C8DE9E5|nr:MULTISPECIES: protein phosphatase CheZ [unclassified Ketobacter]MAQ27644.1 protein phosphatase [Pseudomonadales bacterium]MEC8812972.1 protein phosphatase CheZ [Pseudomonadota bacterium]TNC88575.1 MAG: protein phosphatase [Alcanivorax sp.]HAG95577.1 protein phosphatase [Gammaproteobacteria bacterium]MCK5792807.1 protein phosphatase CheZ [Ketobacter sp.]|tara:strand:- start:36497 stop:37267 length:771 start_codon:yes stop_codon:yes gene_type:complete